MILSSLIEDILDDLADGVQQHPTKKLALKNQAHTRIMQLYENTTCSFENCFASFYSKGYCQRHYQQFTKRGEVKPTSRDYPVKYEGDTQIVYTPKGEILFDKDFNWREAMKTFHINAQGYAGHGRRLMHRLVIGAKKGEIVDHINRNKLDNRRSNLRIVTPSQNQMNKGHQKNNKSGYVGVFRNGKSWSAQISVNRDQKYLGTYRDIKDAVRARNEAVREYFGEHGIIAEI